MPNILYHSEDNILGTELWSECWVNMGNNENILACTGLSDSIFIINYTDETIKNIVTIDTNKNQGIPFIRAHGSQPIVVSTSLTGRIETWDINKGKVIEKFDRCPAGIWASFFPPDKNKLCLSDTDGSVMIYDIVKNMKCDTFTHKSKEISSVSISPDSKMLACASKEGLIEIFDCNSSKLIYMVEAHNMPILATSYSYDGWFLISGSHDGLIKLLDARNSEIITSFNGHSSWITDATFLPGSNTYFVSCSLDGSLKFWETKNRSCTDTIKTHTKGVWSLGLKANQDISLLSSVGDGGDITVLSI